MYKFISIQQCTYNYKYYTRGFGMIQIYELRWYFLEENIELN